MKQNMQASVIGILLLLVGLCALGGCGSKNSSSTVTAGNTNIFYASTVFLNGSTAKGTGYNGFGQFGDGTTINRAAAGSILRPGYFKGLLLGGYHSLAFGTYTAWTAGGNSFGQLGRTLGSGIIQSEVFAPVNFTSDTTPAIPKPRNIVAAAAGGAHSLLTDASGRVWAWGSGAAGQLGSTTFLTSTAPVLVIDQLNATPLSLGTTDVPYGRALAAGGSHSLALTNDGVVYAWGNNGYGQLGASPTTVPSQAGAFAVGGLPPVSRIAAAGSYSMALDSLGYVWAWGYNGRGQIGQDPAVTTAVAVPFRNFSGVRTVAAGLAHVVVLRNDGTVWTWGFNGYGQLGDGTKTDRFSPLHVTVLGSIGSVNAIMAFGNQSFARIGTTWYAWGDNGQGQLGVSTGALSYALTPLPVTGL